MLDERHLVYYKDLCLCKLLEKYDVSEEPIKDRDIAEDACKICIDVLTKEFVDISSTITSMDTILFFLHQYARLRQSNPDVISEKDRVIFRKLCRYVLGEITKVNITEVDGCFITSDAISRLFFITKLTDQFSQRLHDSYMSNGEFSQLELYKDQFAITINSCEYYEFQHNIKESINAEIFKGNCFSENIVQNTAEAIRLYFGDAAECFFDLISTPRDTIIENIENIEFADFCNLIKDNAAYENDHCGVFDLTDIIEAFTGDPFFEGLILRHSNVDIESAIRRPHDINSRTRFRPIIEISSDDEKIYITTKHMLHEALDQIICNLIPFGELPKEWKTNAAMVEYAQRQKDSHDKWLEDPTEEIAQNNNLFLIRDVKSINSINVVKAPIPNSTGTVGQIDFIIIDPIHRVIYVTDCKYSKRKDNFASFCLDKNSFEKDKGYNIKLKHKAEWVATHINDLKKDVGCIGDLEKYSIEILFVTDSLSYYGFYAPHPIIPISLLDSFFKSKLPLVELVKCC